MSVAPPSIAGPDDELPRHAARESGGDPREDEINATRLQIRVLVNEITQLCAGEGAANEFHQTFLSKVAAAMGAPAAAIWRPADGERMALVCHENLAATGLIEDRDRQVRHGALVRQAAAKREPIVSAPQSGRGVARAEEDTGNPTPFLAILAPVVVGQETQAIVEIFQRPDAGPAMQRGFLRFLLEMCEHAQGWHKNRQLRLLRERQELWTKLEEFLRAVHRKLDVRDVAYAIANDGRRVIDCDRVSLAIARGNTYRVESISGVDVVERRAEQVARMTDLVRAVARTGEPLWHEGVGQELPPQIEDPLNRFVDAAHCRALGVIPLFAADVEPTTKNGDEDRPRRAKRAEPIGALVVERMRDSVAAEDMRQRAQAVADHGAKALAHAVAYEGIFLLPVWRALGSLATLVRWKTLPWTIAVVASVVGAIAALVLVPADFDVYAEGKLTPSVARDIFAGLDGIVVETPVRHGSTVVPGDLLARLTNTELDVKINSLLGEREVADARLQTARGALLAATGGGGAKLSIGERARLEGDAAELERQLETIDNELDHQRERQKRLEVRAETAGEVMTWQVEQRLDRRPVRVGQVLMTLADTGGPWEARLQLPERRLVHVDEAIDGLDEGESLDVVCMLTTHAGQEFVGQVVEIHRTAETTQGQGNTLLVRVAIDKNELPELRADTTVRARIRCGRRSIGYVWFHDLVEAVQTHVLFWW